VTLRSSRVKQPADTCLSINHSKVETSRQVSFPRTHKRTWRFV